MKNKPRNKPIRFFDLFCGCGGSSRGAEMAGATSVGALDMWDVATKNYSMNFPESKVYQKMANLISPKSILDTIGPVDLLIASPECTNHSIAKGNVPRCKKSQDTAFEVIRFARVFKPKWIVVENVIQMNIWDKFEKWLNQFIKLGYKTNAGVLDAQYFDTPQTRRRLFIVCDLEKEPTLPSKNVRTRKTVHDILGYGESVNSPWQFSPLKKNGRAKATIQRADRAIKALGKNQPFIMVYYGTDAAGGFQVLERPLRTITTLDRFAYVRKNCTDYEMRMLQPPELAAAMGFPDYHKWIETTRRNKVKLIGNAVCPLVMKAVVTHLIDPENLRKR